MDIAIIIIVICILYKHEISDIIICLTDTIIQLIQPSHAIGSPNCMNISRNRMKTSNLVSNQFSLTYDRGQFILHNHNASYVPNVNPIIFHSYEEYLVYTNNRNKEGNMMSILPNPNPSASIRKNHVLRRPTTNSPNYLRNFTESNHIIPKNSLYNEFNRNPRQNTISSTMNSHIVNEAPINYSSLNSVQMQLQQQMQQQQRRENENLQQQIEQINLKLNSQANQEPFHNDLRANAMSKHFDPMAANHADFCGAYFDYK